MTNTARELAAIQLLADGAAVRAAACAEAAEQLDIIETLARAWLHRWVQR